MGRLWDKCLSPCSGETLEISSGDREDDGASNDGSPSHGDTETHDVTLTSTDATLLNSSPSDDESKRPLQVHLTLGPDGLVEDKKHKFKKEKKVKQPTPSSPATTAAFIVASSVYGQLLVVICLAFFTAKTTTSKIPLIYFEGFYLYLYAVSLIFLLYVWLYLLRGLPSENRNNHHGSGKKSSPLSPKMSKMNETTEKSHGSIFLRIGAIGFGLGTMIYNGLEVSSFLETTHSSPCYSVLIGVNPILQATFTFAQMYFIFTYSRIMISKFKLLARLGIMHLVATNLCTWIRTLGRETIQELQLLVTNSTRTSDAEFTETVMTEDSCDRKDVIMAGLLKTVSPYLYPFIVEYSLIGAVFLYIMWSSIGRRETTRPLINVNGNGSMVSPLVSPLGHIQLTGRGSVEEGRDNISTASSRVTTASHQHHGSSSSLYSCLGSSKGLFSGFLFLVGSITSLIIFFMMLHHPTYARQATVIYEVSHSILLFFCCLATLVAYIKIRKLTFHPVLNDSPDAGLRDILLKVAAFGLYSYSLFGVIAGGMDINSMQHLTVLITSTLNIIQVTLQSLFISDVVCRRRSSYGQPARQLITFLLITNLTLWIIYTFEMQKIEASPVQLGIFGEVTWGLIVRFTLPLSCFYRFHSAITFAEVWKNSYK